MDQHGAIAVGQLLVATQPGRDGYFDQSVILLIEHRGEGTVGLCLNRGSQLSLETVADGLDPAGLPILPILEGGPVNLDMVIALGEPLVQDNPPPGWQPIVDDVGVVDMSFPPELMASSFAQLRVFVGISAWAPGQLEAELIRGSWFRTAAHHEDVFGDHRGLWRRVLRRMGGVTGRWSAWTEHVEQN